MSNPNPENQFKPGKSGNPGGRPKREWTVAGLIEDAMENPVKDSDGKLVPTKKVVYDKLVEMAKDGDIQAIKEISNRLDGMPVQKNVLAGDEDSPILVDVSGVLNKVYGKTKPTSSGKLPKDS